MGRGLGPGSGAVGWCYVCMIFLYVLNNNNWFRKIGSQPLNYCPYIYDTIAFTSYLKGIKFKVQVVRYILESRI